MDISKLKRYRKLRGNIDALGVQIEGLYNTYKSPNLNRIGGVGNNYNGSPVSSAVNHISKLQDDFSAEYFEMVELGKEIEEWLHSISDPEIVAIIRCYFLCGMGWDETTKRVMGSYYSWSASRVKLRRYLEKMEETDGELGTNDAL